MKSLAALGIASASLVSLITLAPPASAADGWCSTTTSVWKSNGRFIHPATSSGSTSCLMGPGSSGPQVAELQRALTICQGLDTGGVDGVYGRKTEAAVKTVQARRSLKVDGIYGPDTNLFAIMWRYYWNDGQVTCSWQ
ncbi:peptidoglycan-binding domain-containing protein [Streptomyces sp. C]|uniref:peptidoglycan-binding domain-containing protein n=1 Tax=Streptomyces sp. C TaxID=253839 RepID=UPI0001B58742|nr:peptidoglycan-binding domain-containing protein [Streptomyces sp. C]EFL13483.1 predicted protein [Streptomyces sp. C]